MGWLGRFFKLSGKASMEKNEGQEYIRKQSQNRDRLYSYADRKEFIKENIGIIAESNRQIEEAKIEYKAVTLYLSDIEKIERLPKIHREKMEDAARHIISLKKDRESMRTRKYDITDMQYRLFERFEMQIPKELASLKEAEKYQKDIDADIMRLEQEKKALLDEKDEIIYKQSFLRGLAKSLFIVVIALFALFAWLTGKTKANMTFPFLLTVLMGMASVLCIFMESRKNAYDIKIVQLKLNKVIMLINKVAIKSVNNRNYLEYVYSKYMVDDYEEFKKRWEQYVMMKDEIKRYAGNTQLLEFYNDILISELEKYNISDTEVWLFQPSAILDSREMVEVRHRLNVRRQKIRERIQANKNLKDEAVNAIKALIKEYPESEADALNMLKKFHLQKDILIDA